MSQAIRLSLDNTTHKDLLKDGGLRKLFNNTLSKAHVFYTPLVNDLKSKDEFERDLRLGGLTGATEIVEGQEIPIQTLPIGTTKTYTQRFFGSGFRMTLAMDRFNKVNLWDKCAKGLAKSQKEAKDIEIHVMFNSPTSTALTCGVGYDSLALANDTHTGLKSGSTTDNFDNYLNASLSISALESVRYYFKTRKDDMGMYVGGSPTTLAFEPTLFITAKEIFGSDLKAHELSNTTNVIKDEMSGLTLYEDPRLTSTTMWFMLDKNSDDFDLNVFTTMEPDFVTKDAPDNTRDRVATSYQMFTYGWGHAGAYCLGKA